MHEHEKIVKKLGGGTAVARAFGTSPQNVNYWQTAGIPWKYRNMVARMCEDRKIRLPKDFLGV